MVSFDVALGNYNKAKAAHSKTQAKLTAAIADLELAKHELEIECGSCHKTTKIKDIEIINRKSGGWYSSSDDGHHYNTWTVWVCPHCTEPQCPPSENEGIFSRKEYSFTYSFEHYVKAVYDWYSDSERCHGRVLQLLEPYLDRQEEARAKREKERKN